MEHKTKVLVTGSNGFLGGHCILQLLHQGYTVGLLKTITLDFTRKLTKNFMLNFAS